MRKKTTSQHQTCKRCKRKMRFEFAVSDELWNNVPDKYANKALCIECFLKLLEKSNKVSMINRDEFLFLGIVGVTNSNFRGILYEI